MASPASAAGVIRLLPAVRRTIDKAVRDAWPHEACGLLIGRHENDDVVVTRAVVSPNLAGSGTDRFEIDPALQLHYQRGLRGTDEAVIGHFHSHPNGRETPSEIDRTAPGDDALIWVIAAAADGGLARLRAFIRHGPETGFSEWRVTE